ncbi:MAG: class I SAM-dependent methyltransferase [Candidatus Paceibacterota bacterium]|jgi:ubiquinone/menaquinone biosynthesis C-methylase UbiE
MDVKYQYDEMGNQYIAGQESFFSKREDWCRIAIARHLSEVKNKKILDIGCGGGVDFKIFEQKGAEVFGIDPSEVMVNEAKKRVANPNNIQIGEYEDIPFPDQTFDIVFGRFSLHYLNNFDKAYNEVQRVLIPRGKLLLVVSHPAFDLTYLLKEEHKNDSLITVELYGNKTKISYPPHILRDYFSLKFFKLFDLIVLDEYGEEELEKKKEDKVPGALLYCARKR